MKSTFVFIFSLTTTLLYGQANTLNLASDVWPPFTDAEGKHTFALDLVKQALARNNVQMKAEILDFKEVMEGIRNGRFDGSAALWRSTDREEYLIFSEPYLENRLILVGKKGSNVSAGSLSVLKGKRIAVVESYAYGSLLEDSKNCVLVKGASDQQNLERLLKGEADYMLVDALLIEYLLEYQSKEAAEYLEIGKNTLIRLPLYFALRKDVPGAGSTIEKFNAEIKKMVADGTYNRILQLNWIATDVNGDGNPELILNGDKAGTQAPVNSYMLSAKNGQATEKSGGYYIKGVLYKNWGDVPPEYKVPKTIAGDPEKIGFGPVFNF